MQIPNCSNCFFAVALLYSGAGGTAFRNRKYNLHLTFRTFVRYIDRTPFDFPTILFGDFIELLYFCGQ